MIQTLSDLKTVRFNEQADGVIILDQTLLPGKEAYLTLTTAEEIWDAIYKFKGTWSTCYRGSGRLWYLCLRPSDRYGGEIRFRE